MQKPLRMLRPILGIWERALERELLRKGVGDLRACVESCADCGRVPLVGEHVHVFDGDKLVCELCRPAHGGEPIRAERVHHSERGHTVRVRARAA
jgi:hypothetical protein